MTSLTQDLVKLIEEMGGQYTMTYVIDVLRGSKSKQVGEAEGEE